MNTAYAVLAILFAAMFVVSVFSDATTNYDLLILAALMNLSARDEPNANTQKCSHPNGMEREKGT